MTDNLIPWLHAQLDAAEASTRELLYWAQQTILTLKEPRLLGKEIPGWHDWPEVEKLCQQRLAELSATRQVLDQHERLLLRDRLRMGPYWDGQRDAWDTAVRVRAEAFDGQPGYQERWRPVGSPKGGA